MDQKIAKLDLSGVMESLKGVQQNPEYHAEGDVYAHTTRVLEALYADPEFQELDDYRKAIMIAAASLHDIGKRATTKFLDGRWQSPKHGSVGSRIARAILWKDFGFSGSEEFYDFRETVCALIFTHCMPTHFLHRQDETPERNIQRLASFGCLNKSFSLKLLTMLVRADLHGRIAPDCKTLLETTELFAESAKELGCYDAAPAFVDNYTRFQWFQGKTNDFSYPLFDDSWGTVYLTIGLPGTGKSTYRKSHLPDVNVISLDEIRKELKIPSGKKQDKVITTAFERAKELLRAHKPFIWDATCVTPDFRRKQLELFRDYHARTKILWLETNWQENLVRNASRPRDQFVPESVIENMLSRLQPPHVSEAVDVEHIML